MRWGSALERSPCHATRSILRTCLPSQCPALSSSLSLRAPRPAPACSTGTGIPSLFSPCNPGLPFVSLASEGWSFPRFASSPPLQCPVSPVHFFCSFPVLLLLLFRPPSPPPPRVCPFSSLARSLRSTLCLIIPPFLPCVFAHRVLPCSLRAGIQQVMPSP